MLKSMNIMTFRDLNNRVDEFTTQIAKTMDKSVANRANTLKDLQKQGFSSNKNDSLRVVLQIK